MSGQENKSDFDPATLDPSVEGAIRRLEMVSKIPKLPQRQDSTDCQLADLYYVANRLGMYDAADVIRIMLDRRRK